HDTTRTVTSLLLSGTFARLRNITWLFSHAGGTIPMLAGRIDAFYGARPNRKEFAPEGIEGEPRRLHYDTANATHPAQRPGLPRLARVPPITSAPGYPSLPTTQSAQLRQLGLKPAALQALGYDNAARLLPRVNA